jgi:undecaprenyl-diphosphatase
VLAPALLYVGLTRLAPLIPTMYHIPPLFSKKFLVEHRALLLTLFLGVLAPLLVVGALAEDVWHGQGFGWDVPILQWLHSYQTPGISRVMLLVTRLGSPPFMLTLGAVILLALWMSRQHGQALFFVVAVGGAGLLNLAAKLVFGRDRPDLWLSLAPEKTFSFPSGHAMGTMALAAALVSLSWSSRWRWPVLGCGALFVFLVGLSRPYLGVHFPSDILAGWAASLAWVTGISIVWRAHIARQQQHFKAQTPGVDPPQQPNASAQD